MIVPGHYPEGARLLIVGQSPGRAEAERGEPFVGVDGQQLRSWLRQMGLDVQATAFDNVHQDFNGDPTYKPTTKECKAGYTRLLQEIATRQPEIVLLLGGVAAHWRFKGGIIALCGRQETTCALQSEHACTMSYLRPTVTQTPNVLQPLMRRDSRSAATPATRKTARQLDTARLCPNSGGGQADDGSSLRDGDGARTDSRVMGRRTPPQWKQSRQPIRESRDCPASPPPTPGNVSQVSVPVCRSVTFICSPHPGYYRNALRDGTARQAAQAETDILSVLHQVAAILKGDVKGGATLPDGRYIDSGIVIC